jgi:hypothetical protein
VYSGSFLESTFTPLLLYFKSNFVLLSFILFSTPEEIFTILSKLKIHLHFYLTGVGMNSENLVGVYSAKNIH